MLNNYILLCLLALVASIQTMPTYNDTNNDSSEEENQDFKLIHSRDVQDKIDGSLHHIKAAGITYKQRINGDQCFVEYDGQFLGENSVIKIRKKMFRVEDCLLERVYHACGPNLILMLSVVCRVVEQHHTSNTLSNFKRDTDLSSKFNWEFLPTRSKRVISESCCENLCNISELTRYCH